MDFNYTELEKFFDKMSDIINFIEKSEYSNRRYKIFLGNGDALTYYVPKESIAHLLGIDTTYLISTGLFNSKNSFDLLKEMCQNPYRVHNAKIQGIIDYNTLFSKYAKNKLAGFKENIKINTNETILVCKYDSSKAYLDGNLAEKYNYVLVKKYSDEKIGILGIVKKYSNFVPMTNQLFDNFEKARDTLDKLIKNQEVTIITGINLFNIDCDFRNSISLTLNAKIEKINDLKQYKNLFNFCIDISEDYEYSIGKLIDNRNDKYEDRDLINSIVNSIKNGKLIDIDTFRNTNLSEVIEAFNDYLCKTQVSQNSDIGETYTKIKKDLEYFKVELTNAEKKVVALTDQNTSLIQEVEALKEENDFNKETISKVYELTKPRTK